MGSKVCRARLPAVPWSDEPCSAIAAGSVTPLTDEAWRLTDDHATRSAARCDRDGGRGPRGEAEIDVRTGFAALNAGRFRRTRRRLRLPRAYVRSAAFSLRGLASL